MLAVDMDDVEESHWTGSKSLLSTSFSKPQPRQISPQKHLAHIPAGMAIVRAHTTFLQYSYNILTLKECLSAVIS